ncbi:MAG: NADH-quinone oxidoreductase subunit N, partial [Verrucomicrobiae bacterium]|nr:NADH-quinone oxidoreductase subunit N [Verrucomicrobiae bacterium]
LGLVAALAVLRLEIANGDAPAATFLLQGPTQFLKSLVLLMAVAAVVFAIPGRFTRHVGEFFALVLLATTGLLLLAGTENLLMLFVSLELVGLSLYALTAFHDRRPESTEAALKYFLIGGVAAALTLFGMSLLYGLTGSLQLAVIGTRLAANPASPLAWAAMVLVVAGLGFKIAVAPFHLWAPDAYQGAPTPAAALIATGSKVVGFLLWVRVVHIGFGSAAAGSAGALPWHPGWLPVIAILAAASMLVGNLTALRQSDLRRLLAYSAVAQAGYGVMGVLDPAPESRAAVLYFAVTYALAVLGVFGVISLLESAGIEPTLGGITGLAHRSPLVAGCLGIFVLSLAGIPPLAGFFGKFFVLLHAVNRGAALDRIWLVALALGTSAIGFYYYLQILKRSLIRPEPDETPALPSSLPMSRLHGAMLVMLAAGVLALGIAPGLLLGPLGSADATTEIISPP